MGYKAARSASSSHGTMDYTSEFLLFVFPQLEFDSLANIINLYVFPAALVVSDGCLWILLSKMRW